MKRIKLTNNFLKFGIFLFGISLILWNCEKQNLVIDNPFSVPSITESKTFFLENNSNLKTKKPNGFISKIKWENSKKENYKKDIDILYSPISVKANRAKSFVASVKINGKIDNQIITLLQNRNASQNTFSGVIFIHNKKGEFICAYSYENGIKTKKMTPKKTNSNFNAKTTCDSNYNLDEIIWIIENSSINDIPNNIECVDIYDYSRNLNSLDSDDNGGGSWSDPSDDLNTDDGPGGGSNSWSDFNCADGYKKDETGKCVPLILQIDDSALKPCMKTILDSIKALSNDLKGIITKFSGYTSGYNWSLIDGTTTNNATAQTSINYDINTGTVTTTFDTNQWSQASDLSWARTILHESIHAYVIATQYNTSTSAERQELLGPNWLNRFTNNGHDFIANNYITPLADALQEFGNRKGYNLDRSFYEDLVWGGLSETDAFNNYPYKDRAMNVIAVELTKKDMNGDTKTQKGQNAGC